MRQQWVPKSSENASPSTNEDVTHELGDSSISTWFLKGELELGFWRRHLTSVPVDRMKDPNQNSRCKGITEWIMPVITSYYLYQARSGCKTLPSKVERYYIYCVCLPSCGWLCRVFNTSIVDDSLSFERIIIPGIYGNRKEKIDKRIESNSFLTMNIQELFVQRKY